MARMFHLVTSVVFRIIGMVLPGKLCSATEDDILDEHFPVYKQRLLSGTMGETMIMFDSIELNEDRESDADYSIIPETIEVSYNPPPRTRANFNMPRYNSWTKLHDEDDNGLMTRRGKVFTTLRFLRYRLFGSNTRLILQNQTLSFESHSIAGELSASAVGATRPNTPDVGKVLQSGVPEEEIVFLKDSPCADGISPVDLLSNTGPTQEPPSANKIIINPPIFEIVGQQSRLLSDASVVSDLSSLSGNQYNPLEFSLETGFEGNSPFLKAVSEDIIRSLERKAKRENRVSALNSFSTSSSHGCLILLMDPMRRIFEIVQVPFTPDEANVGKLLGELQHMATDPRLRKMAYTGFIYNGVHISASMVPVDIISEAESRGKPLFAIPANYSAEQIEILGNSLLETPSVARLLEDELTRLALTVKATPIVTPDSGAKSMKIPPPPHASSEFAPHLTPTSGRFLKCTD